MRSPSPRVASESRRADPSVRFSTLTSTAPARGSPLRTTTAKAPPISARRIRAPTQISEESSIGRHVHLIPQRAVNPGLLPLVQSAANADRTCEEGRMTSQRRKARPASRWVGLLGAALAAAPSAAFAQPADLFLERTAVSAAAERCDLFAPEISAALA